MARLLISAFVVIVLLATNLLVGSANLAFDQLVTSDILWSLRLPRSLVALVGGATLALSGMLTQIVFRNSLASPYTLGVASSAALGTIVAMSFGLSWVYVSSLSLLLSLLCIYLLTWLFYRRLFSTSSLLLLGIALNLFCAGAISIIQVMASKFELASYLSWVMGSVSVVGFSNLLRILPGFILLLVFVLSNKRELSILQIEGEDAVTRGFDPRRLIAIILMLMTFALAILVAELGPIGFIGLVVPHLSRLVFRAGMRDQILGNVCLGAIVLIAADIINRTVFGDFGLPVGVMTTVLGAPALIALILMRR